MAGRWMRGAGGAARAGIYQEITGRIIAELEAGRVPWVRPWTVPGGGTDAAVALPVNAVSGRRYRGINVLSLWAAAAAERGFAGPRWLTFRQALALGGHVRRGERGTGIVFADRIVRDDGGAGGADAGGADPGEGGAGAGKGADTGSAGDGRRAVWVLRRHTVFHVDQCAGLPAAVAGAPAPIPEELRLPAVEALIAASGAEIRVGGDRAAYDVIADRILMPPTAAFRTPADAAATVLHELVHWTGAAHRLGRDLSGRFGSPTYATEELVAEMGAAFTCAAFGITPTVRHADYIGAWLDVLRADARAVVRAAAAASRAADHLLAFAPAPIGGSAAGGGAAEDGGPADEVVPG